MQSEHQPSPANQSNPPPQLHANHPAYPGVLRLAALGYSLNEISRRSGVALSSLHLWFKRDPELQEAHKKGKRIGPRLRILDALKSRPQTWEELVKVTKVNEDDLGLEMSRLSRQGMVASKSWEYETSEELMPGGLLMTMLIPTRIYWLIAGVRKPRG